MTTETAEQPQSDATVWHVMMSLDGYIAARGDSMDWVAAHGPAGPMVDEIRDTTGAVLAGRRWHDIATQRFNGRAGIYGGKWSGPVFVLTHTAPSDPPDKEIRFLSGPIEDVVHTAREAAGGRRLGIFGADVARQALAAGLLDEIAVHLAPVLLGGGIRLYGGHGEMTVPLRRIEATLSPQLTDLRFRVLR
ncbi:dihydrofolate reductase family protein [Jatrophihabitans sp. DSM 45814]